MKLLPISRADWLCAAALWVATLAVFGAGATRLGFYYDDSQWMTDLPSATPAVLWHTMLGYIPGRNLFPFWQFLIYRSLRDPAGHLAALHWLQSALDGLLVVVFFLVLRLLSLPGDLTVMAAGLFSFWPIHGETHFWPTAIPQNLLSTTFVLIFAETSLALAGGGRARTLWLLDTAAFCAALFTYDQPAVVLAAMVAGRVAWAFLERAEGRFAFAASHLPHLAAIILYGLLKWKTAPGAGPTLTIEALRMLRLNLPVTLSDTVGRLWLQKMALLYQKTTPGDWLVALLAAAVLTAASIARCRQAPKTDEPGLTIPGLRRLFLLTSAFYIMAYVPAWIWQVSPRHHLLPSAGLFAALAVGLTLVTATAPARALRVLLLLAAGSATLAFAAASRGESRYWEESFAVKRQLFEEIKPDLAGKQALTLDAFPAYLGPAYLISPHDAGLAPRLFYGRAFPLAPDFTGSIGSVAAPGGVFLHTLLSIYGANQFLFVPDDAALQVRFAGWNQGRLHFEKNPARPLAYESLAPTPSPALSANNIRLAVSNASARRESSDTVVRLQLDAALPEGSYLAAIVSFRRGGGFHRWGVFEGDVGFNAFPVLVSIATGADPRRETARTLRLHDFPETERIQLEFFAASSTHIPIALGRAEAAVER